MCSVFFVFENNFQVKNETLETKMKLKVKIQIR